MGSQDSQSSELAGLGTATNARFSSTVLGGTAAKKFFDVFGNKAAYGGGSGDGDRVTVFNDVQGREPIRMDISNVRELSTVDPDDQLLSNGGAPTLTMVDKGGDVVSGQKFSLDYVLDGTKKTIELVVDTAVNMAATAASGNLVTIGTLNAANTIDGLADAVVAALGTHADFTDGAVNDGTSAFKLTHASGVITFDTGTVAASNNEDYTAGDGIVGVRTNYDDTDGIVISNANDEFDLTVGDQSATGLKITNGTYTNIEAFAAEIQRVIDADGQFREENAVTVVVKEGTTSSDTSQTIKYIALENASGKQMTIAAKTNDSGTFFFGSEDDSSIANTNILASLKDELGLTADKTSYITHGKIDGGVDTTQDGGFVSVTIEDGDATITRAVAVTQEATRTFDDFAGDLGAAINAAFAGDGYSVSVSSTNGNFSLALDQAGAKTISLNGAIIEDAFGSSVSATGSDGEGAAFASMQDVVAAINDDLAAAGGNAEASFANGVMSIQAKTGSAGAASSIAVSGGDLDVLQFGADRSATGYAGNAEAATIDQINIGTVDGAENAIASIDNAIAFINSQRAELGAIENRLDHTINNLSNVVVNTEASKSRIADADFAVETGALTKAQVLSQAATAMLAQANASKQSVLSLLQ